MSEVPEGWRLVVGDGALIEMLITRHFDREDVDVAAHLEAGGHSSVYTRFTGCPSAYSRTHNSTDVQRVQNSSRLARWYAVRQHRLTVELNVCHYFTTKTQRRGT
jgi:hypothetical protein